MSKNVALIATTYNCKNDLEKSFDTLVTNENLQLLKEIIIVDGGSDDGTWESLKYYSSRIGKLKIFQSLGANISKGRNEAIKRTSSDIIVTFDSGTRYDADWLFYMLEPFKDSEVKIVGARTHVYGETLFEKCLAAFYDRKASDEKYMGPSHRGIAYYKKVWEEIGGYPEHVQAGEDTWFNTRWKDIGLKYVLAANAVNHWKVRSTYKGVFRMQRRNTKGHFVLGERSSFLSISFKTSLNILFAVSLFLSIYSLIWGLVGCGIYLAYFLFRLLSKGRYRLFLTHPVRLLTAIYILCTWEAATSIGAVEGVMKYLFLKLSGKNHG